MRCKIYKIVNCMIQYIFNIKTGMILKTTKTIEKKPQIKQTMTGGYES